MCRYATDELSFEMVASTKLTTGAYTEICELCSHAFDEDFEPWLRAYGDAWHMLARRHHQLVSHALWVTRWLQPDGHTPLRTAYIEAVATDSHGYSSV